MLRHGLQLYDAGRKAHVADHGKDVIRALAHGGRVTIRIPALGEGESPTALTDFLGVTRPGQGRPGESELGEHVKPRGSRPTASPSIRNTGDKRGKFEEKGELPATLTNALAPPVSGLGPDRPALLGHDISGGGLGAMDWNGDVILPDGSHGHMLLVFHKPTRNKDGALMVGIETIGPGAPARSATNTASAPARPRPTPRASSTATKATRSAKAASGRTNAWWTCRTWAPGTTAGAGSRS